MEDSFIRTKARMDHSLAVQGIYSEFSPKMSFTQRQEYHRSLSSAASREMETMRANSKIRREIRETEHSEFRSRIADKEYKGPSALRQAYGATMSIAIHNFGRY